VPVRARRQRTTSFGADGRLGYVRLRLENYSDAELKQWADRLLATGWSDVNAYFMHEPTAADVRAGPDELCGHGQLIVKARHANRAHRLRRPDFPIKRWLPSCIDETDHPAPSPVIRTAPGPGHWFARGQFDPDRPGPPGMQAGGRHQRPARLPVAARV